MFDKTVINYLESKGIKVSNDLKAKHGLLVYAKIVDDQFPFEYSFTENRGIWLQAEQYIEMKKNGYIKEVNND